MLLSKLKTLLAQCHLNATEIKPFIAAASSDYTISKANELLHDAIQEKDLEKREKLLIDVIQMCNITRYKILETLKTKEVGGTSGKETSSNN